MSLSNITKPFPASINHLLRQFESTRCLADIKFDKLKEATSPYQLQFLLEDIAMDTVIENMEQPGNAILSYMQKLKKGRFMPLALDQLHMEIEKKKNEIILSLCKILSVNDTQPEVLDIKKDLMENYGVESLYLNNDEEVAKKWLETAQILKAHNIPMPKEIICTDFFLGEYHSSFCALLSKEIGNNTVIINPNSLDEMSLIAASTDSPLHILVHECIHNIQPLLLSFQLKKIPAKYRQTVENLSDYAKDNFASEVHAELLTKKILAKLNPDEEELLQFLGGTWFA